MQAKPPVNSARVPYLDFAEDFVGVISRGEKRATTRCPGPKDTDVTSDLDAVIAQGWALATAGGRSSFALLAVDRVERRALAEVDDSLAQEEGNLVHVRESWPFHGVRSSAPLPLLEQAT
ncbi:unnamed protein product [Effrenium voratum]|nr:unnamed protein product [Effrenium voratum]